MRDAFAAGHDLQLEQPELGLAGFRRHFPDISEQHARANWDLYEPYAFDGVPPGDMDAERWRHTIAYTAKTHGLPKVPAERIHRPEFARTPEPAAA